MRKREMKMTKRGNTVRGLHKQIRGQHVQRTLDIIPHTDTPRQVRDLRHGLDVIGCVLIIAHALYCAHPEPFSPPDTPNHATI